MNENSFIWVANYNDDTEMKEIEKEKEHSFYDIEKEKLSRFGLFGYGMNLYFEIFGGTWKLGGRMFEFIYRDNSNKIEYYLTGQAQMYNDIIQYKTATSDIDLSTEYGVLSPEITQYNIGYKRSLGFNEVIFNFKAELHVPIDKPSYMSLRLSADRSFEDASFIIKKNGETVFETPANLEEFVAAELNWEVIM